MISLLPCSSGKLKLVAVLVLEARTPAAVDHCCSCLVFLNVSLSAFTLVRIDSLDPESTRALTSRVLDCLSFLPSWITSLTKIIGLKCMCFSLLLDLFCLSLLVFFRHLQKNLNRTRLRFSHLSQGNWQPRCLMRSFYKKCHIEWQSTLWKYSFWKKLCLTFYTCYYSLFDLVWFNTILYSITFLNFCLSLLTAEYLF